MGSRRINSQCEKKSRMVGDFIKGWLDHALQPGISVPQTWGTVKHTRTSLSKKATKAGVEGERIQPISTHGWCFCMFLFHIIHVHSLVVLVIKSGTIIPVDFHVLERIAQPRAIWDAKDELWSVGEGEKEGATIDIWVDMLCTQWFFHVFPHPSTTVDLWDSVSISDRGGLVPIVGIPSNIYTELQWMVAKSCTTKRMVETCWNPINNGIINLSAGAAFLPSTVSFMFFWFVNDSKWSYDSMILKYIEVLYMYIRMPINALIPWLMPSHTLR